MRKINSIKGGGNWIETNKTTKSYEFTPDVVLTLTRFSSGFIKMELNGVYFGQDVQAHLDSEGRRVGVDFTNPSEPTLVGTTVKFSGYSMVYTPMSKPEHESKTEKTYSLLGTESNFVGSRPIWVTMFKSHSFVPYKAIWGGSTWIATCYLGISLKSVLISTTEPNRNLRYDTINAKLSHGKDGLKYRVSEGEDGLLAYSLNVDTSYIDIKNIGLELSMSPLRAVVNKFCKANYYTPIIEPYTLRSIIPIIKDVYNIDLYEDELTGTAVKTGGGRRLPKRTTQSKWISTGRTVKLKDGSNRVLFINQDKPSDLRVRKMRLDNNGKLSAIYVKPK